MTHFESEDLPTLPEAKYSAKELDCIEHNDKTTTYGQDGRPIVRLPLDQTQAFIDPITEELLSQIGHSARKALGQFPHNERKLSSNDSARRGFLRDDCYWTS